MLFNFREKYDILGVQIFYIYLKMKELGKH